MSRRLNQAGDKVHRVRRAAAELTRTVRTDGNEVVKRREKAPDVAHRATARRHLRPGQGRADFAADYDAGKVAYPRERRQRHGLRAPSTALNLTRLHASHLQCAAAGPSPRGGRIPPCSRYRSLVAGVPAAEVTRGTSAVHPEDRTARVVLGPRVSPAVELGVWSFRRTRLRRSGSGWRSRWMADFGIHLYRLIRNQPMREAASVDSFSGKLAVVTGGLGHGSRPQ